jgi:hypothetical protein
LTFTVISQGQTQLDLTSELADHPLPGEATSELIAHADVGGMVDAAPIPEFPEIARLAGIDCCCDGCVGVCSEANNGKGFLKNGILGFAHVS